MTTDRQYNKWLIIITIMLVAILEVLDSTIVNVTLPSMMPSLSANQEQVTWVLTSYVVAAAIMLPLTGFLADTLGQKRLLIIAIAGFMTSSVICGMANNLSTMVFFRLCQGAFGASLIPLSQSILRQTFPPEEQGKAMSIWALGIMVAPALGPTLGGYITEYSSWRWVFYINFPVCIIGLILTWLFIPDSKRQKKKIDYLGVLSMFIGIGALQVFLDQGNTKGWFDSHLIVILAFASLYGVLFFILRCATHPTPIVKLSIFKDRNFTLCTIALAIFAASLFGFISLQPIMLESLFGYTALIAGITISPVGFASAIVMCFAPLFMKILPTKVLLTTSLLLEIIGILLMTHYNLATTQAQFMLANAFIGAGMGLFMVPLTTLSLLTLPKQDITEGAGLYTYGRMLGTSFGISLLSTLVSRESQINWNRMGGHINTFNQNLTNWAHAAHMTLQNQQIFGILGNVLSQQSSMTAFLDAYKIIGFCLCLLIPLLWCLKPVDLSGIEIQAH